MDDITRMVYHGARTFPKSKLIPIYFLSRKVVVVGVYTFRIPLTAQSLRHLMPIRRAQKHDPSPVDSNSCGETGSPQSGQVILADHPPHSATKKERAARARNWCFTAFDVFDVKWLDDTNIRYYKYGEETCPTTNKNHLQGWLQLEKEKEMGWMKKLNPTAHFEIIRGSIDSNEEYVSKDGKVQTKGTFKKARQRTDLKKVIEEIKEGKYERLDDSYLKFGRNIETLLDLVKTKENEAKANAEFFSKFQELRPHQVRWLELMDSQDDRKILWIFDKAGNIGKSYFARFMYMKFTEDTIILTNGKDADISFAYGGQKYVIFDYCRSRQDHINYGILESLKNGLVFSSKYESRPKIFMIPKVICLANFMPDMTAMSRDRWHVLTYDGERLAQESVGM